VPTVSHRSSTLPLSRTLTVLTPQGSTTLSTFIFVVVAGSWFVWMGWRCTPAGSITHIASLSHDFNRTPYRDICQIHCSPGFHLPKSSHWTVNPCGRRAAAIRKRAGRVGEKIGRLEAVKGWSWDPIEDQWNSNYEELKSFAKKHGHLRMPYGTGLFRWIVKQRVAHKRGRLPTDKIRRLEAIKGWSWDGRIRRRTKSVQKGR